MRHRTQRLLRYADPRGGASDTASDHHFLDFSDGQRPRRSNVLVWISPAARASAGAAGGSQTYAVELIGDHTLVTLGVGERRVSVRCDKTLRPAGPQVVVFDAACGLLFDANSGARLR